MKRFFTKKSVAIIFTTIFLMVALLTFKFSLAQTTGPTCIARDTYVAGKSPIAPVCKDASGNILFTYQLNGYWLRNNCTANLLGDCRYKTSNLGYGINISQAQSLTAPYDKAYNEYQISIGHTSSATDSEDLSAWPGLSTIFNYSAGILSFYSGTGALIGFLKLLSMALSGFVAIAAFIFDQSITLSILHTKEFFNSSGAVDFIWTMMRDLLNITFIFILLYEAIAKIIGSWGVKSKTTLLNVIISAIFINFSMLIAKILIDAGNMVAVQLYNSILAIGSAGFSSLLFGQLGLTAFAKSALSLSGQMSLIISNLLSITLNIVLIYVFLFGAFVLIGRVVMLVLLTMTSPIGFVAKSVPMLGDYSAAWWKSFIDQILVAPALMFVLFIVTKILSSTDLRSAVTGAKSSLSNNTLDISSFLFYIIIITILLKGMKFVKEKSGEVAGTIVKVATVAAVGAAAVVTGGAALGATGLVSSEGALAAANAAKLAGKGTVGQWGARLAFSAKNIPQSISSSAKGALNVAKSVPGVASKFATGDYEKTGASGLLQGMAREKIIGGLKSATGVDVSAIEKTIKASQANAEKNLAKALEGSTKKEDEKKKGAEHNMAQLKEVGSDAALAAATNYEEKNKVEKAHVEANLENAKRNLKEKQDEEVRTQKIIETAPQGSPELRAAQAAHFEANKAVTLAQADFSKAESKVQEFMKDYNEKLKDETEAARKSAIEDLAKELGLENIEIVGEGEKMTVKQLQNTIRESSKAIREAKRKFINDKIRNGGYLGTLLTGSQAEKFAKKLEMGTYSAETDEEKLLKKLLKEQKKEEKKS